MKHVIGDRTSQSEIEISECHEGPVIYAMQPGGWKNKYLLRKGKFIVPSLKIREGWEWICIDETNSSFGQRNFETLQEALRYVLLSTCTVIQFDNIQEFGRWLAE